MSGDERFFIGELAQRSDVSRDTIRYYESAGVLPEPDRNASGYRVYGPDDVERLEFVDRGQALGLTLAEIADVLEIVSEGREPCVHVRRTLEERLAETRERVRELRALERRLEDALRRAERTEARDGSSCRCRIIEEAAGDGRDRAPDPVAGPEAAGP